MPRVFDGLKVLDFGWIGVGPITARYFADHGATTIRVESATRFDGLRMAPPYKDARPGLNNSQFFANFNASKLSLGLNMARPDARAIAKRLCLEWADVIIEGFTPKQMKAWGLHYDDLSPTRPDLIMLSTCQLGQTGPYARYAGYGNMAASLAGYYEITGWPDRGPCMVYGAYTDMLTPGVGAALITAALDYRRRTGKGQWIDLSQFETGVNHIPTAVLDYTVNGRIATRRGNQDDRGCPHAAYCCQGQDRWISIAVFTDDEWRALVRVMGHPPWAQAERFATFVSRKAHEEELNRLISAWTEPQDAFELEERLQQAGVPAGLVAKQSDLFEDPQLQEWGFFAWCDHKVMGRSPYDGLMSHLSKTPGQVAPAPLLGEHYEEVLKGILRYTDEEVAALIGQGVVEMSLD
ncbi:MAG TPA: CoA transferase [Methylomirabilota bacterium]|jgi:benzylsuccinate CoA-transferase BbsF subunit|nr:CoA transferase [Methylomirabilota bacterium]